MIQSMAGKARARDGCLLSYHIYPRPGKARLVLIHSLGLDAGMWDGVVEELAQGGEAEVLAYDCRGHGQSERRPGPYSVELFADDLAALLDHCGWPSAIVAGCSLGGCVAMAFAAAHPQRAQSLALVDTTAWYGPTAQEEWLKRAATAAEAGFAAMLPVQIGRWFGDRFPAAHANLLEAASRVFLANDMACYQASCALLGSVDLRNVIRALRIPVSVIIGEEDQATPLAMSQSLQEAIPGSRLEMIPGCRHLTPIERPLEIAVILKGLILRTIAAKTA